jgi:hypothetical protein
MITAGAAATANGCLVGKAWYVDAPRWIRYDIAEPRRKTMAVTANLDKVLDKAYEGASLADLINAPVAALAGVSEADAQLLQQAFNIKTVGDLGRTSTSAWRQA